MKIFQFNHLKKVEKNEQYFRDGLKKDGKICDNTTSGGERDESGVVSGTSDS